jgi:hypothetical protein
MNSIQRTITVGLLAAIGAQSACGSTSPQESELARARQRWALSNIRSYDYTAVRSCFCAPAALRPVTVTVTNGAVTQRVYADTGDPVPSTATEFTTVEALFDIIQAAIARHAAVVDVTYDPQRGVPLSISIDNNLQAADDEVSYIVRAFHAR